MNIRPEILDLIHADIDGIATEADRIKLRDAIAHDAAVRDEYRRLRGLCDALASVERAAPPGELAPSVMRRVRTQREEARMGFLGRLRASWPGGPQALRYAYALAAGAAIGVIAMQLVGAGSLFLPGVQERDAAATIGTAPGVSRLELSQAGIRGSATLQPSGAGAAIGLQVTAKVPVELVLRYDPAQDGDRVKVLVVRDGAEQEAGTLRIARER